MATYKRYTVRGGRAASPALWVRVLQIVVVAVACFVAVTAGALTGFLQHTAAQVARNDPGEVKAAASQLTAPRSGRPVDVLIIGSDRRAGQPDLGARSDTLLVVRLDPRTGSVSMLSVPRDLLVTIPGHGQNKINAAYSLGGARLALEVVHRLLGVPINHFVDIDFDGFKQVVNRLGGAYLMIDRRYSNDTAITDYASIDIQPGYQRLNGAQALDFVRFRHDQNGDFTRIVRQQMFLREMKRELAGSATLTSLPRFLSVMSILSHNVTSDIASLGKLYAVVSLALSLNTHHIYQTHIDGSTPTIGGVDYVVATPQQVHAAVREFLHPTPAPRGTQTAATRGRSRGAGAAAAGGPARSGARRARIGDTVHLPLWRALQRRAGLKLFMPAGLPAGLGYDDFRAYRVKTGSGSARAAVAVGTTPQGGFWDVQAIAWSDAPILSSPDATRTIAGGTYSLYYDGAHLTMIAWRRDSVAYWIANTLDEELTNGQMLSLATSSVRVP